MTDQSLSASAVRGVVGISTQPLTTTEVSQRTSIPPATLRYWRSIGIGPKSFKLGRVVRYRQSDVDAWMEAQYMGTAKGDDLGAS